MFSLELDCTTSFWNLFHVNLCLINYVNKFLWSSFWYHFFFFFCDDKKSLYLVLWNFAIYNILRKNVHNILYEKMVKKLGTVKRGNER